MISIRDAVREGSLALKNLSDSPRLDSELLLGLILGLSRIDLVSGSERILTAKEYQQFLDYLARRKEHEPVAYITGTQEFWGLEFEVAPSVLIPRPETEHLIESSLEYIKNLKQKRVTILDLGTGSGCIAVALAFELSARSLDFKILAVDSSTSALHIARSNATRHGVSEQIEFIESDWFESVGDRRFSLIVSNPPYVERDSPDLSPELAYEPDCALFSEKQGLEDIERILQTAPDYLEEDGRLLIECGSDQADRIHSLVSDLHGERMELLFHRDLAGHDRVLECQYSSSLSHKSPFCCKT